MDFDQYADNPADSGNAAANLEEDLFGDDSKYASDPVEAPTVDNVEEFTDKLLNDSDSDVLTAFLRSKGISDRGVDILNEKGEHEYVPFNKLSKREQLDILNTPDVELSDYEVGVINWLRNQNTTLEALVDGVKRKTIAEIQQYNDPSIPNVDNYTDDQIFIADLKSRFPDMTDEELEEELEDAKYDEGLFKRKVDTLRQSFKNDEVALRQKRQIQAEQSRKDLRNNVISAVRNVAKATNEMHNAFQINLQDKEDVMRFLFDEDVNGQSNFYKMSQTPEGLFQLAWYATKGQQAMNELTNAYLRERETSNQLRRDLAKYKPTGRTQTVRRNSGTRNSGDRYNMSGYLK